MDLFWRCRHVHSLRDLLQEGRHLVRKVVRGDPSQALRNDRAAARVRLHKSLKNGAAHKYALILRNDPLFSTVDRLIPLPVLVDQVLEVYDASLAHLHRHLSAVDDAEQR